ncbi:MAG: NADH-quinone oxidoreductase subunit C [Holophagaceae bacterium]|nr:NADH-quinone oxidoreductase subunit C [Acidobacteriota bacterium]
MSILDSLLEKCPSSIQDSYRFRGDQTVIVAPTSFVTLVDLLISEGFNFLVDITAVDWLGKTEHPARFEVVYHWLNLDSQERLRVKVRLQENESLPSLAIKFKTADWYEREVYDMFGISFSGHPNLTRLLTWSDFPGHPLRKDFPLDGGDPFCMSDSTSPFTH